MKLARLAKEGMDSTEDGMLLGKAQTLALAIIGEGCLSQLPSVCRIAAVGVRTQDDSNYQAVWGADQAVSEYRSCTRPPPISCVPLN
jgi:hypothetical protein